MKIMEKAAAIGGVLLLASGAGWMLHTYMGYQKGQTEYAQIADRYTDSIQNSGQKNDRKQGITTEPGTELGQGEVVAGSLLEEGSVHTVLPDDAPKRKQIDWDGLLERNPEVAAWIEIPALDLSYPVVQADDNEYYLHRSLDREYLFAGCIFMDCFNDPELTNYNTILYGHNMRDGSMFAALKNLRDPDIYSSCPFFWVYTPKADCLYRIFSVREASVGSATYSVRFADSAEYSRWLEKMSEDTGIAAEVDLQQGDRVVTLSTCTGDTVTRQIVQGVEVARATNDT